MLYLLGSNLLEQTQTDGVVFFFDQPVWPLTISGMITSR